jgi:hypothetical protein
LLTIKKDSAFDELEKVVEHVSKNEEDRIRTQLILSKLNDEQSYSISWLFLEDFIDPPKYFAIIKFLSGLSLLTFAASFFIPNLIILLICLVTTNLIFQAPPTNLWVKVVG